MEFDNWTVIGVGRPQARVAEPGLRMLAWNVPPSELIHIPEHWLKYPEPEASLHYLLSIIYIGFFIASMIGNGLVIWVFSTAKPLQTPSNIFVVNLAIFDFIMMAKAPIFIYNSFNRGFELGFIGCQIFAFVGTLSGIGAGMTNACIAYDRYNTIARPFDGKLSRTKAVIMVVFIWIYTIPWAILPAMEVWGKFAPEGYLTACTVDFFTITFDNRLFVTAMFVFSYCIPMIMIIYYYSQIVSHVFAHEKALKEQAKKMNVESLRSNQNQNSQSVEIRIAKAAITVCFLFVTSWTPYAVAAMIGIYGDQNLLTPGVTMIPALNAKMVACIDPYVYAISHPKYRIELNRRLPWLAINETASDTNSTATEATTPPAAVA
uniref:Putative ultraviolet II opsin n=1 Tax=Thermonectus marmoratus TaxID=183381 RepID=B5LXX9_THEMR|nr:putative ultraviolet II opsin [Thermonectus marmoratus]